MVPVEFATDALPGGVAQSTGQLPIIQKPDDGCGDLIGTGAIDQQPGIAIEHSDVAAVMLPAAMLAGIIGLAGMAGVPLSKSRRLGFE